jgi:hypothetical protein
MLSAVVGCIHRSPEQRVLAAFKDYSGTRVERPMNAPDTNAAKCTPSQTGVAFIKGDTAIVKMWQDCAGPPCPVGQNCMGNVMRFETDYLLVRRNGKWTVERPVGAGAMVAS